MGTNDGFRNFSANCDLERSTSTDRHAGLSWGAKGAINAPPAVGEGGLAHTRAPSHHRAPSPLVHALLPTHTREEENELGKSVSIVHPSGSGRDHKMAVLRRGEQGRARAQGWSLMCGEDQESAPRTAPRHAGGCPGELIFRERAEDSGDLGKAGAAAALTSSFSSVGLTSLPVSDWGPQKLRARLGFSRVCTSGPAWTTEWQLVFATHPTGGLAVRTPRGSKVGTGGPHELCQAAPGACPCPVQPSSRLWLRPGARVGGP